MPRAYLHRPDICGVMAIMPPAAGVRGEHARASYSSTAEITLATFAATEDVSGHSAFVFSTQLGTAKLYITDPVDSSSRLIRSDAVSVSSLLVYNVLYRIPAGKLTFTPTASAAGVVTGEFCNSKLG